MLVAFFRYSRDQAFWVLREHSGFVVAMTAGSVAGSVGGGLLLGAVPTGAVIVPLLVTLLAGVRRQGLATQGSTAGVPIRVSLGGPLRGTHRATDRLDTVSYFAPKK